MQYTWATFHAVGDTRVTSIKARDPYALEHGGRENNSMPYADIFIAAKHCEAMRDCIVMHTGGWEDEASLREMRRLARAAGAAVDDRQCKDLAEAIMRFATDLFSTSGHEKWAYGQTSGHDVLRLRILREVKAFQDRLSYMEAMRRGGGQNDDATQSRAPKER